MQQKNESKIGISIVVPCYNEEVSLPRFLQEITKTMDSTKLILSKYFAREEQNNDDNKKKPLYELIFINDGSKDGTLFMLQKLQEEYSQYEIRIFSFSRNFGKEAGILAGLEQARGEGVILLDADLQDPPSLIPQMIQTWLESNREIKIIYARRSDRNGESKVRAIFSELFYKISNYISEVKIESGVRDFRLMDKEVIQALLRLREYHRFSKAMFAWVGFRSKCLEYEYIPHFKDSSSWSFWNLFKYAIEGIISFSTMPLRIAFILGFIMSIISGGYGIYRLIWTILYGNLVPGYPSLICIITFIGGMQLILLGVIGEYIARIYEQVKQRPHYILESLGGNLDSNISCDIKEKI
ncbi:glycosyltransferase [Helicobacter muridarum]|uniref:Glycosyltransferase n=1 Tax=Helicobacter muridarum TaxID=216 RepID=A0A099TYJ7_9HELI|nr:glycosyltransferase family 2 protein [Helicobacter muridarum]TLE00768.1 glycosyltransferase [Helicobacter muridarum]STQ86551.1 glycosyltransferase [Helicobacter muridarum]